ncbi:MAG: DUF2505 domain-containing protein [Gordonia sp. (in: high G+C Gram-positive bacteria)]|uniref:DUF2505 domain-containing protein n=1 Tax=Gordonia sp. (in: high G+C Gram-positive bacteria) TaxID=84139 RepID=UPI0039E39824
MARRLSYSARYHFSPEKLYRAQSERGYWDDLTAGFRMLTPICEVDEFTSGPDGMRVVLKEGIPKEMLPPLAQTVVGKDMIITRVETFGAFDPSTTEGTYTASIPAGPGSLKGRQLLTRSDTGCTVRKTTEVKVYVPFINGKLEQMMLVNLVDLFRAEAEFTRDWVEKNLD